ncbi:hypothetical protein [Rhodococcus qingshengii]|uniref:hypothetical protein n=1 Tax=Rhodococcus qingshengii TaxID=334542 RepID=UPI001F35D2C1|nr:hypothetical protein [Rhodococcus qingshengii]
MTHTVAATMAGNPVFTSEAYVSDAMSERALLAAELVMALPDRETWQARYFETAEAQGYLVADAWLIVATAHLME